MVHREHLRFAASLKGTLMNVNQISKCTRATARMSALLSVTALVTAIASPAKAQTEAHAVCTAADAAYSTAVASGDARNVAALFTSDGLLGPPEGFFRGPAAIAAFYTAVKPGATLVATTHTATEVSGVVLCAGDYAFTLAPGSPIKEVAGHFTEVLVKDEGGYKIAQLSTNYTPQPLAKVAP
jgi:ketosteroid isomerase-like protein